jgi:hypothetical protein
VTGEPANGRSPGARWLIAALVVTAAVSLALLLVPIVAHVESGPPARKEWQSLLELEGVRAAVGLALPVLLVAIPLLLPRGAARRLGTLIVTFLLAAGVVLGLLSIGLFYLPTLTLLIVALLRSDSVPA